MSKSKITWKSLKTNKKISIGIIIIFGLSIIGFSLPHLYKVDWIGLGEEKIISITEEEAVNFYNGKIIKLKKKTEQIKPRKKLWDWLGLLSFLTIPILAVILTTKFQKDQQKKAERTANEEALQNYIDKMSELLIDKKLNSDEDSLLDTKLNIARARTASIMRRIHKSSELKISIINFLIDAELITELNINFLDGINFSQINLSRGKLSGTNFRGTNLEKANLEKANLEKAKLKKANLKKANLKKANLQEANLQEANLEKAKLSGARLDDANLNGTRLDFAKINHAQLYNVNLTNANLSSAQLNDANLSSAQLNNANLSSAQLNNANLSSAQLNDANFSSAQLNRANLSGAQLQDANLSSAELNDANLSSAQLNNANLSSAELNNANLSGAQLQDANLSGAQLNDTQLQDANIDSTKFWDEKLREAKDISPEQIKKAKNWEKAVYSPQFRKKLGLQPLTSELDQILRPSPEKAAEEEDRYEDF